MSREVLEKDPKITLDLEDEECGWYWRIFKHCEERSQ